MKKTLIAISALLLSVNCFAAETPAPAEAEPAVAESATPAQIEAGKQYIELPTFPSSEREVIEFFSFNCPSCFRFETTFHGPQAIEKNLPEGVKLKRYHLEDFGLLGPELSQAWAIANVLGIQDKVLEALYTAVQQDRKVKKADDIKAIFVSLGVDGEKFEQMKDNFSVKAFITQQADAFKELQPATIPAIIVNRKYYINPRALDQSSAEATINDYARVAAFLTDLKPNNNSKKK